MTKRVFRTGALLAFLLGASPAAAGTLTSATWTQVVTPPRDIAFSFARSTGQLGATGSSTASSVGVTLSFPALATSFFLPHASLVELGWHIAVTQAGPQNITATAGMGGGSPGIPGTVIVMSAPHVAMGVDQSMFMVGTNTLIQVPINVGAQGQFTNTFIVLGVNAQLTVDFYAWTPGTLVFTGLTSNNSPRPDVTVMGSFDLTPNGGGTVTLVAPSRINVQSSILSKVGLLNLTTLTLNFVPEPGTLLLLAAGAAFLLGTARPRR